MKKENSIFLEHILESIKKIQIFCKNLSFEVFKKDEKTQDAVIRRIEIIGEAVKNLPSDFTERYPNIPWKEIAGMRDKLTHHYFGVDILAVWKVVKEDLIILKKQIEDIQRKGDFN